MPSQGPNGPSTGANNASIGINPWMNPGNVTADDATYATGAVGMGSATQYLAATGFGFSIPPGATINGILVEWERKADSGANVVDNAARIVKGGAIGATDKSSASTWPTAEAFASYGGAADLWGETWTAADINASDFGAAVSAVANASPDFASVDYVRITVTYTAAANQQPGSVTIARRPDQPTDPMFIE